jgi:hypothetical protein
LKTYISNLKEEITTYLFGTVQSLNFFNDEPMKDGKKKALFEGSMVRVLPLTTRFE